jgi:hypothetical protein
VITRWQQIGLTVAITLCLVALAIGAAAVVIHVMTP